MSLKPAACQWRSGGKGEGRGSGARSPSGPACAPAPISDKEIGILLPNNQRQHRTLHLQKDVLPYALCYISAIHTRVLEEQPGNVSACTWTKADAGQD